LSNHTFNKVAIVLKSIATLQSSIRHFLSTTMNKDNEERVWCTLSLLLNLQDSFMPYFEVNLHFFYE